jgi:hypothetical protein
VQVKSRFVDEDGSKKLREDGTFVSDVRDETFRPRDDLFMLFVAVDGPTARIDTAWLVPSSVLNEAAFRVTVTGNRLVRFQASIKPESQDKWREFRLEPQALPEMLLRYAAALEPERIYGRLRSWIATRRPLHYMTTRLAQKHRS